MSNYDITQFHKDAATVLRRHGKRIQHGFYTITEYEEGPLKITTENNIFGVKVYLYGNPIKTVKIDSIIGEFFLEEAIKDEEFWRGKNG